MKLIGEVNIPGDKSISHRAIMLNSIAYGKAKIYNFLFSDDCITTINIFKNLGVKIIIEDKFILVHGNGYESLKKSKQVLNCNNSGTTARLLLGILTGLPFESELTGDISLVKRPMKRVTKQLKLLNGNIELTNDNNLPAKVLISNVTNNNIKLDVSSAQVKSAIILCALKNKERTIITEKEQTRNHTELMLKYMDADISTKGLNIYVSGKNKLKAKDVYIPGDISSATFFIVSCLIVPNSEITIKNCGLNETRGGILKVLDNIDAFYKIINKHKMCNELVGDIKIKYTKNLKPFKICESLVPNLIDEIPVLALLATQIEGTSIIKDAKELRVKESDRINVTVSQLNKLGANIVELDDGMVISGKTKLHKNEVDTFNDHRISMMLKVAKLLCCDLKIKNSECDKISYPNFENDLNNLIK